MNKKEKFINISQMKKVDSRLIWALSIAALIVSGLSVLYVDQAFALWLKEINISSYYRIYRTLTDAGEAVFYFCFAIFVFVSSWATLKWHRKLTESSRERFQKFREQSLFLLCALLTSGIALHLLKMLFGRQRPHATEDFQAHVFHPFNLHWHFHSMPSGHSQTLLTAATACWLLYPRSGWVVFPAALFLACTRLAMQAHFVSDVIMGSIVGFVVTALIARRFAQRWSGLNIK